jgi:hypothetical protein
MIPYVLPDRVGNQAEVLANSGGLFVGCVVPTGNALLWGWAIAIDGGGPIGGMGV